MNSYNSDRSSGQWHLGRRLILMLLLVVAIALGLVILSRQNVNVPLQFFNILEDVTIGLIAGAGSRYLLRDRSGLIRGLASAAMAVIGLGVLGYYSDGKSGLDLVKFLRSSVDWPRLTNAITAAHWNNLSGSFHFPHFPMNWLNVAHLLIATDVSWMAIRAWSSRSSSVYVGGSAYQITPRTSSTRASVPSVASYPQVHSPSSSGSRSRVKRKKAGIKPMRAPVSSRSKRWNPLRRGREVQLAVYEEHRCPYCLEPVKRNDPRGTVECEVCHALHHKDCWDITGICQVPHLNT
ncbi:MAG TPA: hypothetical protein VHM28_11810 [Anaerolineales bacterium]|nr:hypothetical protein [Anaerolineales bacterium]